MVTASTTASLSALPGVTGSPVAAPGVSVQDRLAVLDDAQEWSAFSRPVADRPSCWESSVVFEGMHCAACALTIEEALRAVPGVESVRVSAASHRGRIVWSDAAVKP
jgi:Cu2+-exporting ATPase